MEFVVTLSMERAGSDGEAETLLDAFLATARDRSPAIAEHLPTHTIEVTFSVEASTADEAFEAARPIFARALAAAGLRHRPIIGLRIETLDRAAAPEPQPA